jgi:spore germination cell wall hydrolase CwlJ-like protein
MTESAALLDRFLLALCIYREARGEPLHGKELVAWTILGRAYDVKHRWPTTIAGVILQPWQFSSFNKDDPNAVQFPIGNASLAAWNECVAVADHALSSPPPVVVNHYHVTGLQPAWKDDSKVVAVVGAHTFYCL